MAAASQVDESIFTQVKTTPVVTMNPTIGVPEQWRDYVIVDEAPFIPNVGTIGVTEELTEKERGITIAPDTIIEGLKCPVMPVDILRLSLTEKVLRAIVKQPHPFDRFIKNHPTSKRWKSRR